MIALDEIDHRILAALQADSRMSMRTLAETLHISRASAYNRVEKLQSSGVIQGFTIKIDPVKAGLGTSAYITLSLDQGDWRNTCEALQALPGIEHIGLLGGEFDALLLVRARDNAGLRRLVLGDIQSIPGVLSTRTLLVFEEPAGRGVVFAAEPE